MTARAGAGTVPVVGDQNQLDYIRHHLGEFQGPYLEVGSRDYGSTADLRSLVPAGSPYVGVDMSAGDGVDLVLDLTVGFEAIDEALGGERFGTIFCLSVMEHSARPFRMADNMTRLLAEGGKLCISVPFAWKFHGYPSDYWRFTHAGVMQLFPDLQFDLDKAALSTGRGGDLRPLDEGLGRVTFGGGRRLRPLLRLCRRILGYRYVMPPTLINMIGRRA